MPSLLYHPKEKKYNAQVIASALNIVQRRTGLRSSALERFLGVGHTEFHRLKRAQSGVSPAKFAWLMSGLAEVYDRHIYRG